jgi:hypothetical protein
LNSHIYIFISDQSPNLSTFFLWKSPFVPLLATTKPTAREAADDRRKNCWNSRCCFPVRVQNQYLGKWDEHGRTARGGHRLPKFNLGPRHALPFTIRPANGPLLKGPYSCFRGGQQGKADGLLLPPWTPPRHTSSLPERQEGDSFQDRGWPPIKYPLSITKDRHALRYYAQRAATPISALWPFQGRLPAGRVACGRSLPPWTPYALSL